MGGQGIISAGLLIGQAASMYEHKEAVMTEDYSPYITGGWSKADIVISDEPIDYPLVSKPDVLVAMSQDGLDDNWRVTQPNAVIIVESSIVDPKTVTGRKVFGIPAMRMAEDLGRKVVANIVTLGFLTAKAHVVSREAIETAIVTRYAKAADLNRKAFTRGYEFSSEEVS